MFTIDYKNGWSGVLKAVICLILGLVIIFGRGGDSFLALLLGVVLTYYGITRLLSSISIRQKAKQYDIKFDKTSGTRNESMKINKDYIDSAREVDYEKE
ncbi:MAG: hypothetical protein IK143_01805 [Bacteroidales bacterium]|nr:hypothetical protein [Bacteroidales bacterium]